MHAHMYTIHALYTVHSYTSYHANLCFGQVEVKSWNTVLSWELIRPRTWFVCVCMWGRGKNHSLCCYRPQSVLLQIRSMLLQIQSVLLQIQSALLQTTVCATTDHSLCYYRSSLCYYRPQSALLQTTVCALCKLVGISKCCDS